LVKPALSGRKLVQPLRGEFPDDLKGLVAQYGNSGAFNGGRLREACGIYERMIEANATVALTVAGALTPAGLGGLMARAVEAGLVDLVVATGANLYHDIHFGLGLPVYQGDFRADDVELLRERVVRVYDVFIDFETLEETDRFVAGVLNTLAGAGPFGSAQVHRALGETLLAEGAAPELSLLATCARCDVPVYTPAFADSSIGMNVAQRALEGHEIRVDQSLDVLETAAIVHGSELNGVIELGGGTPKNFYLQTEPFLDQFLGIRTKGHDYVVQISTDAPYWGGLSGATPSEAASWGKVAPGSLERNSVVVYCDVTVAAPVFFGHVLSTGARRELRRLYRVRESSAHTLRRDYENRTQSVR
jgi:deoxyhypusine synthase